MTARPLRRVGALAFAASLLAVGCGDQGGSSRGPAGIQHPDFPAAPELPAKPWHPDGDAFLVEEPAYRLENSDRIIAHIASTGDLRIRTGSVVPDSAGKTSGIRLNLAAEDDPVYEIVKGTEPGHFGRVGTIWVHNGQYAPRSPWGATVRVADDVVIQGHPMRNYSDSKVHIYDPWDRTITEIQHFEWWPGPSIRAHGLSQYSLDDPSTEITGQSAARIPLAETYLRFDDAMVGWTQLQTMAVPEAARGRWLHPATNSDGTSDHPDAVPMGAILRLRPEVLERLERDGAGPQSLAVARSLAGPGVMVVDTGGHASFSLEPDARWDQTDLAAIRALTLADFEVWARAEP